MYPICRRRPIYALLLAIFVAALISPLPAAGNESYADAFPTIPAADWVGLRLILLPQSKSLQQYGYQELYRDTDNDYVPLRYTDYVGRIARIVGIGHGRAPDGKIFDEAELQLEDNKETIHGDIDSGCMNDVAPVSDLEAARKRYLGKTLWLAADHLNTYNADKDVSASPASSAWHAAFGKVKVKQFSPVKILDIVPGWYASTPIRFILQEEGNTRQRGYVDVHMSDTNVPESLQNIGRFEDTFLETDPRKIYAWSPKVWAAIENKEVFVGMTAQQVQMSWGEPKAIHKTSGRTYEEQWVYGRKNILFMKNGTLRTMQK